MGFVQACKSFIPALAVAGLLTAPAVATRTHRAPTASYSKTAKKKPASHQLHGQRQIDPDRAREIQTALIREHYLTGEPTGQWDAQSQAAMSRFQADQGWQTKLTPDSRALIKLGLGPSHDSSGLLSTNPASTPVASNAPQTSTPAPSGFTNR
jgi:peptidoglycan hydrolase-like protein with peptidoglycan-binding domain